MNSSTPTLTLDPSFDLHAAGRRNTDAARASMEQAYRRAARALGCDVRIGSYYLDVPAACRAGLTNEQMIALWQAAHDAIRESTPGRWVLRRPVAHLRAIGQRIREPQP